MAPWNESSLKLILRSGSVFYYQDRKLTSPLPHYFVVMNISPLSDRFLILTVASSQVDKVKKRRSGLPSESLVEISPDDYPDFTKPSIIDCNNVFVKSRNELAALLNRNAESKRDMHSSLVEKLREGVLCSPLIEQEVKNLLSHNP